MSAQTLEITLCRLYTDPLFRSQFMNDPKQALLSFDLTEDERNSLLKIDKAGLLMASKSFFHKRKKRYSSQTFLKKVSMKVKKWINENMGFL